MRNLEVMESMAERFGSFSCMFTKYDSLAVEFHRDWVEGTQFVYKHNGVEIDRERALDFCPYFEDIHE